MVARDPLDHKVEAYSLLVVMLFTGEVGLMKL